LADQIIERSKREGRVANIKCQQTPSGGKHIGNANDVIRAYFPYKVVLEKGHKAEFVHTSDDRDPMKEVPLRLADLDGNWHDSKKLLDFSKYMGVPYCNIPDPFKCCESWSKHFTKVWMKGLEMVGMRPKMYYVDDLYKEGKMRPFVKQVLEKVDIAKEIAAKFQETKRVDTYMPFDAICTNCGRLTSISSFDLKNWTVKFTCGGKALKKKRAEGCGFEGETSLDNGKLQWRFEWPALWALFHTTYEPFGKDHAEGSYPQGKEVMRRIFEIEPPIPFVYEFFLVSGEKMSASKGNVYIIQDMMKVMEPGPFLLFYAKKAQKQRDFDLKNVYTMVDEFDRAERFYFGERDKSTHFEDNYSRIYELIVDKLPKKMPKRIPYTFAAFISQISEDKRRRELILKDYLKDATAEDIKNGLIRIELADFWVKHYAPDEYKVKILEHKPKFGVSPDLKFFFEEVAKEVERGASGDELQDFIYSESKRRNLESGKVFRTAYQLFLGKDKGPRLGPFLAFLDRDFVVNRLKLKG